MLELASGTVHLWARDLDQHVDTLDLSLLNAEEAARAARFRFDHHRRRFITHRAWLRRVLALYLDVAPHALCFGAVANDKPVLSLPAGAVGLEFNLSHSDRHALCALCRDSAVGVDVERRRDIKDALAIAARHFGPRELAWMQAAEGDQRMARFFTVWTRKEAFIKATGEGLSRGLASFDVRPAQGGVCEVDELTPGAAPWYVQSLSSNADVVAALCSHLPAPRLCWPAVPPGLDAALRPAS
ncbi:MAG: 4'-phosphopantetheinyl transferase superfamily protein [Proteobacteria bacterium]|nr:4'-phosphopantetheinyl transferase superfamily protein [Pseudomonadota bacterium]